MAAMYKKLVHRNRRTALRSRQLNKLANERLKHQLCLLQASSGRCDLSHQRELALVRGELQELSEEQNNYGSKGPLWHKEKFREPAPTPQTGSRRYSRNTCGSPADETYRKDSAGYVEVTPYPSLTSAVSCNLGKCRFFPCRKPSTYHSFGIQSLYQNFDQGNRITGFRVQDSVMDRCKKVVSPEPENGGRRSSFSVPLIRTPSVKPTCTYLSFPTQMQRIRNREYQLTFNRKYRNRMERPKDWCTNYGEPVPCRRLIKPVIAVPLRERM